PIRASCSEVGAADSSDSTIYCECDGGRIEPEGCRGNPSRAQKISSMLKTYSQQTQDISVDRVPLFGVYHCKMTQLLYTCKEGEDH
ncbi:hypothetical protein CHARACLAT_029012, partial [Characodon lateralis]|nr:hypothetical protein [Characodon lateralis]